MNKILIVSNIVLLGIIILSNRGSTQITAVAFEDDPCSKKLAEAYIRNDVQEFESNISYKLAVQMSRAYKADPGKKFICNGTTITGVEDASSVVFDLALLKKYIWYIESTMCREECSGAPLQLGLRFYYGKYPGAKGMLNDSSLKGVDPSYASRHTLFMVPVMRHLFTKEIYRDFNPGSVGKGCDLSKAFTFNNKFWILAKLGDPGDDGSQENHGGLRPPPAGSGEFPDN